MPILNLVHVEPKTRVKMPSVQRTLNALNIAMCA